MAQSLLTQRGVEYGATMQAAAKKHLAKKWRSKVKVCSSPSSSSSSSCSSSESEAGSSVEREFSIVKEGNFATGPLKLRIAARKVKRGEEEENVAAPGGGKQKGKTKIDKKRCLQTKDPRGACSGPYSNCKQPRSSRRCSTSGSSSSSSSSGSSSSGTTGSSSSGSSSSGSCSSTSGSSSASSSGSSSGSSSSSSSSSGSSSGSESESCCKYGRCSRRRRRRRKSKVRRKTRCPLRGKACSESSRDSFSDSRERSARDKQLQVNEIDCFSISSSDEDDAGADNGAGQQECFSMWRKVEEEHCAIIEKSDMQVLSVTNAEVECNINQMEEEERDLNTDSSSKSNNQNEVGFDFVCMEQIPVMKEHIASGTSIDLDVLPSSSLSNVSPDSGIQSSGDSPLRIECELPPPQRTKNQTDSLGDFYSRTSVTETSDNKLQVPQGKLNPPALSPPILTPPDPLWTAGSSLSLPSCTEKRKRPEDHPAPLLVQVNVEVKYHHQHPDPIDTKVQSMFSDYKRMEFPTPSKSIMESGNSSSLSLCTNISEMPSNDKVPDSFSQSSLNLIFNDSPIVTEKSEIFHEQTSSQALSTSDSRRKRNRSQKRNTDINSKADNELQLLVQSVQDSISSQFQGVESDELSDVDVNSIPVTALTCDTTSDSFCDKLSAEDNIEMLLNDRTCIHDDQKPTKSIEAAKNEICHVDMCISPPQEETKSLPTSLMGKSLEDTSSNAVCELVSQETRLSPDIYNSEPVQRCEVDEIVKPLTDTISKSPKPLNAETSNNSTPIVSEFLVSQLFDAPNTAEEVKVVENASEDINESTNHDRCSASPFDVNELVDGKVNSEPREESAPLETEAVNCEVRNRGRKKSVKRGRRKSKHNSLKAKNSNFISEDVDLSAQKDNSNQNESINDSLLSNSAQISNSDSDVINRNPVDMPPKPMCNSNVSKSLLVRNLDFLKGDMSENIEDYEALLEIPVIVTDDKDPPKVNDSEIVQQPLRKNVLSDITSSKLQTVPSLKTTAKSPRLKSSKRKSHGKTSKQSSPPSMFSNAAKEKILDSKTIKEIDTNSDLNVNNIENTESKKKIKDQYDTASKIDKVETSISLCLTSTDTAQNEINMDDEIASKTNGDNFLKNKTANKDLENVSELEDNVFTEKVIVTQCKKRGRKSKRKPQPKIVLENKPVTTNNDTMEIESPALFDDSNIQEMDISLKTNALPDLPIKPLSKKQAKDDSLKSPVLVDQPIVNGLDQIPDVDEKNDLEISLKLSSTRSRPVRNRNKKSAERSVFLSYDAVIDEVAANGKDKPQLDTVKASSISPEPQTSSSDSIETTSPDSCLKSLRRKSKKLSTADELVQLPPAVSDVIANKASNSSHDSNQNSLVTDPVVSEKPSKLQKNNKHVSKNADVPAVEEDPTPAADNVERKDNTVLRHTKRKCLSKSKVSESDAVDASSTSPPQDIKSSQPCLSPIEVKKSGRRRSTALRKKESSAQDSVLSKSSDMNSVSPSNKPDTSDLKTISTKQELNKKNKVESDPVLSKDLANGSYSVESPPRRNMRQKSANKNIKVEVASKGKKVDSVKDELIPNKVKNISPKDKSPKNGLTIEKLPCVESKDADFIDNNHFPTKNGKKEVVKPKVEEEKENFGITAADKISPGKQKAKLGKDSKSQSVKVLSEECKKGWTYSVDACAVDYPERESDGLSSLSVNEEAMDAYSDACGSSGLDRHSSLEVHPNKRKKQFNRKKLVNDPSFLTDLEKLTKQLKSCCISKNHAKLKGVNLSILIPTVFQFGPFIKGRPQKLARLLHLLQNSTLPKAKASASQEKSKKVLKGKAAPKTLPNQKQRPPVSENCLPLKKRRCLVPTNQVPPSKTAVSDPPAPKQSLAKRMANSFDETIEECIRKHMMRDIPVEKPIVSTTASRSKAKSKPNHAPNPLTKFDSYSETIDSCAKNTVSISKEDPPSEDAEDIPLASLANLKGKRKPTDVIQAYRQKRKRLLKEACVKAQKKETGSPPEVVNGQKKKRRFNKTGFVRVKKKKAKPAVVPQPVVPVATAAAAGDVIDLTTEDTYLDAIESVVKAAEVRSRRKRKNVAQKCEIEILDIASGNDDNDAVECVGSKKQKLVEPDEELEPKYRQIIPVTEPSSGRRPITADPRKARKREVHFPKKKFLRAGLYSSCFKEEPPVAKKTSSCSKKSRSREVKEYVPEDHEFGLMPPPIHVGRYLREKRCEYKLPFDLWWLYKHKQLVYNDEASNNYKKIRTNVYVDIKPDSTKNEDDQPCMCTPPKDNKRKGCGVDCLNRMMYVECTPQLCPCRDLCSNQRIFKHEWSPGLERFMTRNRGWGIRTTEFIRSGEFILEYVGEVVSDTEFRHRMAERYRNDQHHYCLSLDSGTVIDGYRLAGEGRFVNHSCEPNCEMQKWYVNGHYRVGLFSMKDIFPNTELCYDYNFINYNLETQQTCRCGSSKCRGFIGGRSQRLNGQAKEKLQKEKQRKAIADSKKGPGRPKKRKDQRPVETQKEHMRNEYLPYNRQSFTIQMKPMSHQQRCYVQKHHCFLLRNYERVKRAKDEARLRAEKEAEREEAANNPDAFHAQFTALNTARSVKTRRLANAEENTELAKTAKLAQVFKDIFTAVTSCKGEDGTTLASPFFQLPSKRKNAEYFTKIKLPIDFATIEKNIITGQYKSVDAFEDDFLRLFENAEEYHGRTSELGHKISLLRKVYDGAKTDAMILFEDILGDSMSSVFASSKTEENRAEEDDEVIRCICNIFKDEGLMIQCEKCFVWQHCDCIGVDGKVEKYLCEQCSGIELSREILMVPRPHYASPECQYYLTMLLGELQIKQGDCVYLRRDPDNTSQPPSDSVQEQIAAQGVESNDAAARESLRSKKTEHLDIFRIERIWKDEQNNKFVFGHHYLRPHETYHEPSRKFFSNEVFRVPLYEIIPLSSIVGLCCVLDLSTYCKGRPKGFKEEDIYICEYRVDKTAHLFYKISKIKYLVCTKKYAFEHFEKRRNPKRTFLPHTVPSVYSKKKGDKASLNTKADANPKEEKRKRGAPKDIETRLEESPESREQKRTRLNQLLLTMLSSQQCKQTVDLSYLLEGGLGKRIRRKATLS